MKLSTMFMINAVLAILFGLGFTLMPATVLSFYAIQLPDGGLFVARLLGIEFIGFAIITWQLRYAEGGSSEVRGVMLGLWVSELIGFAFSLYYQLQGIANGLGWSTVVIYLLLGLGFLYFYMRKPAA